MADKASGVAVAARLGVAACTETPIRQIEAYALVEGAERNEMSKAGDSPRQRQLRAAAIVEEQLGAWLVAERLSERISTELGSAYTVRVARSWFNDFDENGSQLDSGRWEVVISTRCEHAEFAMTRPDNVTLDEDMVARTLIAAVRSGENGGGCRCKRPEETFDGLTAAECLDIYQRRQRDGHCVYTELDGRPMRIALAGYDLTPLQLSIARREWSAALRARVKEQKAKERVEVIVDDERWEP